MTMSRRAPPATGITAPEPSAVIWLTYRTLNPGVSPVMSNTIRSAHGPVAIRTRSMWPVDMPGASRGSEPQAATGQPEGAASTIGPPPASAMAGVIVAMPVQRTRAGSKRLSRIGPSLSVYGEWDIEPANLNQPVVEDPSPQVADLIDLVRTVLGHFQHQRVVNLEK